VRVCTIQLGLSLVITIDTDEFTWGEFERLHKETSDAAQILDLIGGIGGLAADDFDRLICFGNGDDIESLVAAAVMYRLADESRVREIKERAGWGIALAAAPNVQGCLPRKLLNRYHIETRSRSHSARWANSLAAERPN
jgi:hypothetical protein